MPPREFDEIENYENPNFRWVSLIVLLLAVAGFLSLAWYAYQTGSDHRVDGEVVVIEADDQPIKEIPQDRGGEEFPHQDKTIYRVLSPEQRDQEDVQVMPEPEEPDMPRAKPQQPKAEAADRKVAQIIQKAVEETQRDVARHKDRERPAADAPAKQPAPPEPKAEVKPQPRPQPRSEPKPKPAPQPAPPKPAEEPAETLSGVLVQLGAFRSHADAQAHWEKLQRQHPAIVGGLQHTIIRADLGDKGIYYRLRAGSFRSETIAEATCTQLAKRQLGCFVVK